MIYVEKKNHFHSNAITRYYSTPTRRHCNDIKIYYSYLWRMTHVGIFYSRNQSQLLGYRGKLSSGTSQGLISSKISIYLWRYCYIMQIYKINYGCHFFQSFGDTCNP